MTTHIFKYTDFTSEEIIQYAADKEFVYDNTPEFDTDEVGMYNNPYMFGIESDRLQFVSDGLPVECYVERAMEKSEAHGWKYDLTQQQGGKYLLLVGSIDLPYMLPALYVRSRMSTKTLGARPKRLPKKTAKVQLEGGFNDFFDVYVHSGEDLQAFESLAPNLMHLVLGLGYEIDIEFAGNRIYLYRHLTSNWTQKQSEDDVYIHLGYDEYTSFIDFCTSNAKYIARTVRSARLKSQDKSLPFYKTATWQNIPKISYALKVAMYATLGTLLLLAGVFIIMYLEKSFPAQTYIAEDIGSICLIFAMIGLCIGLIDRNVRLMRRRKRLMERYNSQTTSPDDIRLKTI